MWYWLLKYVFLGPLLTCLVGRKSKDWNMFRVPGRRSWPATIWR